MKKFSGHTILAAWQFLFVFLGSSWLLAPGLNQILSDRTTLISEYESFAQPYSLLFRSLDIGAAILLLSISVYIFHKRKPSYQSMLLILIGLGFLIDPILQITCNVRAHTCQTSESMVFIAHGIESIITALGIFVLSLLDAKTRKRVISVGFVLFQLGYILPSVTHLNSHGQFNSISQYLYQYISLIWIAWYVKDNFFSTNIVRGSKKWHSVIRYAASGWVLLNGILALTLSLTHISLFGSVKELYLPRDTAWLAQHGVIIGITLIYLSRHLLRGERTARHIVLIIIGLEALKYAVISPSWYFALLYSFSFSLLFCVVDDFRRGAVPLTWLVRLKDTVYIVSTLLVVSLLAIAILHRESRVAYVTEKSVLYAFHSASHTPILSILLTHVTTVFLSTGLIAVSWVLFRPSKLPVEKRMNNVRLRNLLELYSTSSEDYFKLWPEDKQYFWDDSNSGFITYKRAGSVAFALPDPIIDPELQLSIILEFRDWLKARRYTACFMPIMEENKNLYKDMTTLQIGASAIVNCEEFLTNTRNEKWWRWKMNKAKKQGYEFFEAQPPHAQSLVEEVQEVSNTWLSAGNHKERGFALGYFDKQYLQHCKLYFIKDSSGVIIAFANQLPNLNQQNVSTIDLMRYVPEVKDTMPFLLANIIKAMSDEGYQFFDLGFVPFASSNGTLIALTRAISSRNFSATGLEQFKNKFKPTWQNAYLAYEGDLIDLAAIALNVEDVMERGDSS